MAPTPLFAESLAALKARCRLSSEKSGDAVSVFESEVENVSLRLIRDLGLATIANINATTLPAGTPTTNAQYLRKLAAQTEEKMVFQGCMRRLPTVFADASGSMLAEWNEAPTSPARGANIRDEIERLDIEIAEALMLLRGETEQGSAKRVRAFAAGPEDGPVAVGTSHLRGFCR